MLVIMYPDSCVLSLKSQRPDTYASMISRRYHLYGMDTGGSEIHVSIQSKVVVVGVVAKVCILSQRCQSGAVQNAIIIFALRMILQTCSNNV